MGTHVDPDLLLEALKATSDDTADSDTCRSVLESGARLRAWITAQEARFTTRLRELNTIGAAQPPADVHASIHGQTARDAHTNDRRASTIEHAPNFGDALEAGTIGAAHVDALAAAIAACNNEAVTAELFERSEDLLAHARSSTPEAFSRSVAALRRRLEQAHGIDRDKQNRQDTFLSRRLNQTTGMTEGRYALHPELANKIFGKIDREVASMIAAGEARRDPEYTGRTVNRNRLAAEAWGTLITNNTDTGPRPEVADITVIIDAATLATGTIHNHTVCETSDGGPIPVALVQRLACDGYLTGIIVDTHGTALHVGRTTRHATRTQRRALAQQYRNCAIGNCDIPFERCEIHHIKPWEHGGPTDLPNLIPTCSRHHHVLHAEGWQLTLKPDRTLIVTDIEGRTIYNTPPPTRQTDAA